MGKVLECSCKHQFQSATYGGNRRYHVERRKEKDRPVVYRCTVCGAERYDNGENVAKKK